MGKFLRATMHCPKLCALLIFGVALTVVSLDDSESELDSAAPPSAAPLPITSAAVKCRGNAQDQTQLKGTLDCESNPFKNKAKNKGSACLENLSSGKFYNASADGQGSCKPFNSKGAIGSTTIFDRTSNQPRSGLVTKAFVAHPNKANG